MLDGETYVLEAVRDVLRKKLTLSDEQCDCEYDTQIPGIAGDFYIAVIGAGFETGPKHSASGGVHDILHSVQVYTLVRAVAARDKRRSISLENLTGLNHQIDRVIKAIDHQVDLMSYANALMFSEYPSNAPFIAPLKLTRVDAKPSMVNADTYGGAMAATKGTTPYVAMARSVYFGQMRRMQTITQLDPAGVVA